MNKVRFNKVRLSLAVLLCLCATSMVDAKVKLPALISDGMVLQREQPIKVWGTADAGENVQVKFLKNATPTGVKGGKLKVAYTVTADANGRWTLTLPAMKPGGPYILQVNDIELKDILVGDVWLCSGQSNMELPVSRVTDMFRDEIAAYENTNIRQLKVPNIFNFHAPQADLPDYVAWKPLTQENVMNFSALAYFFAKAMYEKNSIPIGLINSSWGGTPVEAWISEEGLKEFPKYINEKRQYEDDAYLKSIKQTEGLNFYRWNTSLYRGDAGLHETTPWYAANYNDKDWQTVDLFSTDWGSNGLNPINGSHWFRKKVEVPQEWNGKEATLRLGCIVDADSVYVNGTFVGTVSYQYPPRIYTIPAGVLKAGKNTVTIRLISNNGYPHFVKEKPYKIICGNEEVSLQGEWKYRLGASMPPAPGMMFFCYKPVCLYNAMIAPLQNYGIRGVLWYQGESNVDRRNEYAALLTAMIADWRSTFDKPELPFYIVELADFLSKDDIGGRQAWAEMRKEQAKVAETNRNTRLIRNSDLGEWNDIHPLDKKTLGQRAAESALETDNK
ncbi:sialate O-acetylesterase [Bacteroides sp. AM16-24]|uniref:sialate O-acetylesterase n=1 Tax=Bacteroides sp. AM16-24 TaxID=2292002 RepID=UPI000E519E5D|nr:MULTISPECIES: sialate O-acetylesterase [Bacteroides]RHI10032.1 sialate O-acetylesterase [Bacteroides sp. AM16-24]